MHTISRYQITGELGRGGMGVVYRAYDPAPIDREVAVKTLPAFTDPLAVELFYTECRILKSFSHPNIIELFDMGEFDDRGHRRPFFVMPLLQGEILADTIRKAPRSLTVERVVEIMRQTCRGLHAAHERGLVHRDLKPANIFVMPDDSVKIIDFGVARSVDGLSRSDGFEAGTLLYMAPEQVRRHGVSPRSDIFSLGVVCYEALTGRQPFYRHSETAVIDAILTYVPPLASEINPAVNPNLSRVIQKAIAKQSRDRFSSSREFGDALQKALRKEAIELFDPAPLQPRIATGENAVASDEDHVATEIISELEAAASVGLQRPLLPAAVNHTARRKRRAVLEPAWRVADVMRSLVTTLRTTPIPRTALLVATIALATVSAGHSATTMGAAGVDVRTLPVGATIRVDNQLRGTSPLRLDLPRGQHLVEATLGGHQTASTTVLVETRRPHSIVLSLTPTMPALRMTTRDSHGALLATTTATSRAASLLVRAEHGAVPNLLPHQHRIVLTMDGSSTADPKAVTISPRREAVVSFGHDIGHISRQLSRDTTAPGTAAGAPAADAATLNIVADATTEVVLAQDSHALRSITGSIALSLPAGAYRLTTRGPAGVEASTPVRVSAGDSKTVDVRNLVVTGMERFDLSTWRPSNGWYTHRGGGFVLYNSAQPFGRFTFTMRLNRGSRTRWVVAFKDSANYVLCEIDDKYYARTEVIDGARQASRRVEHRMGHDVTAVHIAIDVRRTDVVTSFNDDDINWREVDTWKQATVAASQDDRADWRFGFVLPGGKDDIYISHFFYAPDRAAATMQ